MDKEADRKRSETYIKGNMSEAKSRVVEGGDEGKIGTKLSGKGRGYAEREL